MEREVRVGTKLQMVCGWSLCPKISVGQHHRLEMFATLSPYLASHLPSQSPLDALVIFQAPVQFRELKSRMIPEVEHSVDLNRLQ